jgi:predicted GNAT family acetyltransferase
MALDELQHTIPTNPAITVREVGKSDLSTAATTTTRAYGMPFDVAELIVRAHLLNKVVRCRTYLAYLSHVEEPVGVAVMVELPNSPAVLMASAATVAAHRGQGIYSALMARRLDDALAAGRQTAIVQALGTTSAPICKKLGFQDVCRLEMYGWKPSD